MPLVLRRAQGYWNPDDYDVLDDGRTVGRIYRIKAALEIWWWGVSFQLTGRKSYGDAPTRDVAMIAFRSEDERWRQSSKSG
jgi:hypothetical protein